MTQMNKRLETIRESERKSHTEIYTKEKLYETDSWLKKPIKTVQELLPLLSEKNKLRVLDLGCGVGRNSIYVAKEFADKDCRIDCVDLLPIAIEKLNEYAIDYGIAHSINGIVSAIEDYKISPGIYDLIMAVSALEHVDGEDSFYRKLQACLSVSFDGWKVLKSSISDQEYEIPRGDTVSRLSTRVVTFLAQKI